METIRLVPAVFDIFFDRESTGNEKYEREYITLESDDDAMTHWFRNANSRGETGDTDPVVLNFMLELYRKLDRIEQLLTQNTPHREPLEYKGKIESIGFDHFKLNEPMLSSKERYYGRLELPTYPKREIALYFEAVSADVAKITRIHSRDEDEWGTYMRSRERAMIRHLKGNE